MSFLDANISFILDLSSYPRPHCFRTSERTECTNFSAAQTFIDDRYLVGCQPSWRGPVMHLSAVHRGLAFKKRSLILLQDTLSTSLRRVGGKSDGGIDLMGSWWLPNTFVGLSLLLETVRDDDVTVT